MKTLKKCAKKTEHHNNDKINDVPGSNAHPSGPSVKSLIYGAGVQGSVPDEVWYEAMEQS